MTYTFADMSRDSRRSLAAYRSRRWQRVEAAALRFFSLFGGRWSVLAAVTVATATSTFV